MDLRWVGLQRAGTGGRCNNSPDHLKAFFKSEADDGMVGDLGLTNLISINSPIALFKFASYSFRSII